MRFIKMNNGGLVNLDKVKLISCYEAHDQWIIKFNFGDVSTEFDFYCGEDARQEMERIEAYIQQVDSKE